MLRTIPPRGGGNPALIATFACPTFIIVQVIGANTLFLAETQQQLALVSDTGEVDALQIAAAAGIVGLWWNGDLYAAGSQAIGVTFKAFIGIPGVTTSTGIMAGGTQTAYGLGSTMQ